MLAFAPRRPLRSLPALGPLVVASAIALPLLAVPAHAAAPAPTAEPEPELAEDVPDDGDVMPDEPVDPALEAFEARLDPEALALFESLDDAGLEDLFARVDRGEALSAVETRIVEAMQAQIVATYEAELKYQTGDVAIGSGLATLHLGEDFRYIGPEQTDRILEEAWGNPPGPPTLGMIVPADTSPVDPAAGWGVIITYVEDGHVEDDDAEDIDYDELLEEMKKDTEAQNPARTSQGYPPMHLVGWAEPPSYQADQHRLYWAKELAVDGDAETSLNYAIRVLGRKGVLELNAIARTSQMSAIKPAMERVLSRVEFDVGNRYADFDPDIDDVAAYGIGGLIAGKVLAKAGFFALILKFLLAAKKLLIVGAIALAAGLKAFFSRKKKSDDDVG